MKTLTACPVCGSENIVLEYHGGTTRADCPAGDWTVFRCAACNVGFQNPQPSWQDLESFYTEDYQAYDPAHGSEGQSDDEIADRARADGEFRHVRISEGQRVLDVGCGGGLFLRVCRLLGAEVKGVEPFAPAARNAQASGLDVFSGTLERYCEEAASQGTAFDLITANHVLEHSPQPVETLRAMRSLVAEGGTIWISVPNAACGFARRMQWRWHSADLPFHLIQFTPESLAAAGERADLCVGRTATTSFPVAVAASVRGELRFRWKVPRAITGRIGWIERSFSPWLAKRLDARGVGEAIVCEFARTSD